MKKNYCAPLVPTANVAVNKSRIKLYSKGLEMPTYYLQKGQEFQIELFNPTTDVVLAKIILNGNAISQGGLVLNPGQRVFLDRYFDVAKKFLFDTYVVANTSEVKKAIEHNGDIKIEFYKERQDNNFIISPTWVTNTFGAYKWDTTTGTDPKYLTNTLTGSIGSVGNPININTSNATLSTSVSTAIGGSAALYSSSVSHVNYNDTIKTSITTSSLNEPSPITRSLKAKKSIETGRVEQGSVSNQKFETVSKKFEYMPFHTIEYKMLPASQKVNTLSDINVKRYCTNCGSKLGKTDKFCSNCGKKA